jgi:hypothetical protein
MNLCSIGCFYKKNEEVPHSPRAMLWVVGSMAKRGVRVLVNFWFRCQVATISGGLRAGGCCSFSFGLLLGLAMMPSLSSSDVACDTDTEQQHKLTPVS